MNYLGVDWGKRKIGLALGNKETKMALPFAIIDTQEKDYWSKIKKIIQEEQPTAIVVGAPISLKGGEMKNIVWQEFIDKLNVFKLPVILEDERLSSKYAESIAHQLGKKKRADDDDVAAAAILQSYLDRTFGH